MGVLSKNLSPGSGSIVVTPTLVTGNYTVLSTDQRVEIDATSGNIIITLPTITAAFKNKPSILFVRKDASAFTVTFVGTSSNYPDENFQIGNCPRLETIKIYASNDGTWTKDGYGLEEQQRVYANLSTGLITSGLLGDDPNQVFTNNGDGTFDVNFGGEFQIADRVNDDNTTPVTDNRFFKIRVRIFNWAAETNLASGSDGEFWITVDENSNIETTLSTTGSLLLPVFSDSGPNLNTHLQLGGLVKTAGVIDVLESSPVVDNNLPNIIRHIARSGIGIVNSDDIPITISPIAATIQLALGAGITFTGAPGQWIISGGLTTNFFRSIATSPASIFLIDRAGDGNIISITTSANVTQYESSPGVFSLIGANKVAKRLYQATSTFITELLGETTYSGGSRLADAVADDPDLNRPGLTSLLPKVTELSCEDSTADLTLSVNEFKIPKQFR